MTKTIVSPASSILPGERFCATYRLRADAASVQARARALALEQSIEMPLEAVTQPWVRDRVVARVASIEPVQPAGGASGFDVTLSFATRTTGLEAGQLLNMLFGNCSLQPDVELLDFEPPGELLEALPGPRFGLDGWRRALGLDQPLLPHEACPIVASQVARLP